jgi:hypothetical protein
MNWIGRQLKVWYYASLICALIVGIGGCDSGDRPGDSSGANVIETFDYADTPNKLDRDLRGCLRSIDVRVVKTTRPGWRFRFSGVLPAEEVGFAELPSGGVIYLWLAPSRSAARRAANLANAKLRNAGVESAGVMVYGRGIAAVALNPAPSVNAEAKRVFECLRHT